LILVEREVGIKPAFSRVVGQFELITGDQRQNQNWERSDQPYTQVQKHTEKMRVSK
jgi:hypothetical protein